MTTRPTNVKVGPFTWSITFGEEELEDVRSATGEDNYGLTIPDQHRILIMTKKRPEQALRETVVHEVLHACVHTFAVEFPTEGSDYKREERVVAAMATPLLCVIQDNPVLMRWLFNTEEG